MTENKNIITVKNAEGDPNTTAEIIIQNKIDFEPKVSVIIPVYNVEKYLRECLDSVVNQTLKEIEIITVDDGSTDSSLEILKEYAQKDNRFIVLTQQNQGAGMARNLGIKTSKGEYIMFLDSDDWYELNACEISYKTIKDHNSDILIFGDYTYDGNKTYPSWRTKLMDKCSLCDLQPFVWNKIYKHSFLKSNNIFMPKLKTAEDIVFNFVCGFYTDKYSRIDTPLITYRQLREGSLTSDTNGILYDLNAFKYLYDMPLFQNQELNTQLEIIKRFLDFQVWNVQKWSAKKYRHKIKKHIHLFLKTLEKYYSKEVLFKVKPYTELKNIFNKKKTLKKVYFCGIKILTIKQKKNTLYFYLFGFIKFLKILKKDF